MSHLLFCHVSPDDIRDMPFFRTIWDPHSNDNLLIFWHFAAPIDKFCFPEKVEADYLTSVVWFSTHPHLMELDPSADLLFSFCKRGSCMTSWLPPTVISSHMSILRLPCVNLVSPVLGGVFTWRVKLISAFWNMHGINHRCTDVKLQKYYIYVSKRCVCVCVCTIGQIGKVQKRHSNVGVPPQLGLSG